MNDHEKAVRSLERNYDHDLQIIQRVTGPPGPDIILTPAGRSWGMFSLKGDSGHHPDPGEDAARWPEPFTVDDVDDPGWEGE